MLENQALKISKQLEELILKGEFAENERLNEIELAKNFGVSRTPIREAIQKLAASGLVQQIPKRGAFVKSPDTLEVMMLFEAMAELEASCAKLAVRRISNGALKELNSLNDSCGKALENNDVEMYYRENEKFHFIVYEQSGNKYLCNEAKILNKRLKPYRKIQLQLRGRMGQSLQEHNAVVEALEARDIQQAADAIRDHVGVQGERFIDLIATFSAASSEPKNKVS